MPNFDPDAFLKQPAEKKVKGFDPDAFLQDSSNDNIQRPGLAEEFGNATQGMAMGVADVMNPANYPHAIETLVRAPFQEKTSGGPVDKTLGALQKASKQTFFPEMTPESTAASLNTLEKQKLQFLFPNLIEPKPLAQNYQESLKDQGVASEQLNKDSRGAGALIANVVSAGTMAKDILKVSKLGDILSKGIKSVANSKAFESLNPLGKQATRLIIEERMQPIGEQLLKDDIVTSLASKKTMLDKLDNKLEDYGKTIGGFAKKADEIAKTDPTIVGFSMPVFQNQVIENVISPLIKNGQQGTAKAISNWLQDLKAPNASEITFEQAQKIKSLLGKNQANFKVATDKGSVPEFKKVYGILNDLHEQGIDAALSKSNPGDYEKFLEAKKGFRNLSDAEVFLENAVARNVKNNDFGLPEWIGGAGSQSIPEQLLKMGVIKGIRSKGNQTIASFADTIGNKLAEKPKATDIAGFLGSLQSLGLGGK